MTFCASRTDGYPYLATMQLLAIRRPSRYGATGANKLTLRMSPISPRKIRRSVRTYVSVYGDLR